MTYSDRSWSRKIGLASWLVLVGALFASFGEGAIAQNQIVPDNTLGGERSTVTPDVIKGMESDRNLKSAT